MKTDTFNSIESLPISIGCIGGSGSRMVSQLFLDQNYYFGHCLNNANDNLWFSLIFRSFEALTSTDDEFAILMDTFVSKMTIGSLSTDQKLLIKKIVKSPHNLAESFLNKSLSSLLNNDLQTKLPEKWGWKEPNSHLFLTQLNQYFPQLKFIYIIRHPLDMAYSENQNQLKFFGKYFLGESCEITPYYSLKFWLLVYFKIKKQKEIMGDRLYILNYDELIKKPFKSVKDLFEKMEICCSDRSISQASKIVQAPLSIGRYKNHSLNVFDKSDIDLVNKEGIFEEIKY